jgi:hypothetical protein
LPGGVSAQVTACRFQKFHKISESQAKTQLFFHFGIAIHKKIDMLLSKYTLQKESFYEEETMAFFRGWRFGAGGCPGDSGLYYGCP